jgi:osmotically-inducible protein OsmY
MIRKGGTLKTLLRAACAALVIVACGCSQAQQQRAQATANDALIATQVKAKIAGIDPATLSLVTVDVQNKRVTLTGQVHSEQERSQVDAAARSIAGVASVDDRMRVNSSAPTAKEIATDLELQARVQTAIAAQTGVNALKIAVTAHHGTVTLSGSVTNGTVRTLVLQTVHAVPGVARVVNRIRVHP